MSNPIHSHPYLLPSSEYTSGEVVGNSRKLVVVENTLVKHPAANAIFNDLRRAIKLQDLDIEDAWMFYNEAVAKKFLAEAVQDLPPESQMWANDPVRLATYEALRVKANLVTFNI